MPKKIYMPIDSADLANFSYKGVYVSLTIDIRKWTVTKRDFAGKPCEHNQSQKLPIVLRVTLNSKRLYLSIGEKSTWSDWIEMCKHEQSTRVRSDSARRTELKLHLSNIKPLICQMVDEGTFTLERFKDRYNGVVDTDVTIYTIWDEIIQAKRNTDKTGTARCNVDIKKRFEKDMGKNVAFSDINHLFIQKWVDSMKKRELSVTSIGISLRTFRAVVNVCIDRKLIKGNTKDMFKDTGYNKAQSRKHEFLDVPTMQRLYEFWERGEAKDEKGKELFFAKEKNAIFRDLGLFLFMYLGNGQNLADTLRLTYDGWYYATKGTQLRFLRHKTRERNECASEVIFPITSEIKKIIEKHGNEPQLNRRVFPIMSESITPEQEVWVIQRYNRYIREHMVKVTEILGLEQCPSSTWARHSFATNLNNSGRVPYKYISDSMGHSGNGDITSNYIGSYPLHKMLEYNGYLLNEEKLTDKKTTLLTWLNDLSEKERKELIQEITK